MNEVENKKKGFDEYEIEDAIRTLLRAEEIKGDAKLMKAIVPKLKKKVKAIESLEDLKTVKNNRDMEEMH